MSSRWLRFFGIFPSIRCMASSKSSHWVLKVATFPDSGPIRSWGIPVSCQVWRKQDSQKFVHKNFKRSYSGFPVSCHKFIWYSEVHASSDHVGYQVIFIFTVNSGFDWTTSGEHHVTHLLSFRHFFQYFLRSICIFFHQEPHVLELFCLII